MVRALTSCKTPHQMEFLILSCRALASAPCSPGSRPGRLPAPASGCWGFSSAIGVRLLAGLAWSGLGWTDTGAVGLEDMDRDTLQ